MEVVLSLVTIFRLNFVVLKHWHPHTLFSRGFVNSNIIEFVTLFGILTAKKVPGSKAKNVQNGEATKNNFFELDFHSVSTIDENSAEVSLIYKALSVSSIVDMKIDDIFVALPSSEICYGITTTV